MGALLRHRESKAAAFFAAAKKSGVGQYRVELTPASLALQLGPATPAAGAFDLSVLAGDAGVEAAVWALGRADVAGDAALPPAPGPKPTFEHVRRDPARRAPVVISLAFTALAAAPLAVLVVALKAAGVNAKLFPAGTAALPALAFHACVAALLGLVLLFWARLNVVETLPLAGGLGAATALAGRAALGAHAARRTGGDAHKKAE